MRDESVLAYDSVGDVAEELGVTVLSQLFVLLRAEALHQEASLVATGSL